MEANPKWLRRSFALALQAREKGNHPFGALMVLDDKMMWESENTVVTDRSPVFHAEWNLVKTASQQFSSEEIKNSVLYASTEPCAMCSGALFWVGFRKVVYGCSVATLAKYASGSFSVPCRSIFDYAKHPLEIIGPELEEEASVVHEGFWN